MAWLDAARQRLAQRRRGASDQPGNASTPSPPAEASPAASTGTPAGPPSGSSAPVPSQAAATQVDGQRQGMPDAAGELGAEPPVVVSRPATVQFGPGLERVGVLTWLRLGFFVALGVFAATALTSALSSVTTILVQTLIAAFLAVSLDPLVRALSRRGLPRPLAVIVILTAFITLITLFLLSVIPPLVNQVNQFAEQVPEYISNLQRESQRFRDLNEQFDITGRLQQILADVPANLAGSLVDVIRRVFGAAAGTLLVFVLMIYFLLDLPRLRRSAPRLVPLRSRARFRSIMDLVLDKVGAYMIGQFTISLIAGCAAFVALSLLDAAAPLPLAITVAVTAIIPLIGATLGAIISVVVTALATEIWPTAVVLLVFFLIYQQTENYLIAPRVQRSAVDLSAPAVLLAGIIGASIQGLLGALMAIPLAAAIKVVIIEQIEAHERDAAPRPRS